MKDSLLLIMTPNMSLEKWDAKGQLSRELNYYEELSKRSALKLIIFSYGRLDLNYKLPGIAILIMPDWIPSSIPFKLQNVIYSIYSLIFYRKWFNRVVISKTNQFSAFNFGLLLRVFYGIPVITRMGFYYSHFNKISLSRKIQETVAFKFSKAILTTSQEATNYIMQSYRVPANKILTILNSINFERFKAISVEKEWDVIVVGRLEKSKNIALVLEVLNKLPGKSLIIGEGRLESLVKAASVNNNQISWISRVDNVDLPLFYNKAKCFMLLSEYEGNPKVLLEAMACGLPCVVTDAPGTRECVTHNQNGLIVQKDSAEIVNAIKLILSDDRKSKSLSLNAINWVKSRCNYLDNINKEVELYAKLIK